MRDYGKNTNKGMAHYSEGGKVERTETMPSGAQQWVRGETKGDKLETLNRHYEAHGQRLRKHIDTPSYAGGSTKERDSLMKAGGMQHRAFMDEVRKPRRRGTSK
jgi:hypothetical protein